MKSKLINPMMIAALAFVTLAVPPNAATGQGRAVGVGSCEAVPNRVEHDVTSVVDVALAQTVNERQYNEMKQAGGVNAVIYGIPAGANWSAFQQHLKVYQSTLNFHRYEKYTERYVETTFTDKTAEMYLACLARANDGLGLMPQHIGRTAYTVAVLYHRVDVKPGIRGELLGSSQNVSPVSFEDADRQLKEQESYVGGVNLRFVIVPTDPKLETVLALKVGSQSAAIVLPPLEVPIIKTKIVRSGMVVLQAGGGGPEWVSKEVCVSPDKPQGKLIPSTAEMIKEGPPYAHPAIPAIRYNRGFADRACAEATIHNDTLVWAEGWSGYLSVVEIYAEMP
jgi:hypothetical protein